jgi:hypothetical protein
VLFGLGRQQVLQLVQPWAGGARTCAPARPRRIAVVDPAFHRRQRTDPGAHFEAAQQPDEAHQIAARAGAPGEIAGAAVHLMPVPGDGEFHRADADGFQPDQFALPERSADRGNRGTRRPARIRAAGRASGAGRAAAKASSNRSRRIKRTCAIDNPPPGACARPCTFQIDASGRANRYGPPEKFCSRLAQGGVPVDHDAAGVGIGQVGGGDQRLRLLQR